jgi:hypothetical protein
MNSKKTLKLIGRKTIHVRKSTSDTKRATVAVTITASGHTLTPVVIFKGEERQDQEKGILYLPHQHALSDAEECMDGRACHAFLGGACPQAVYRGSTGAHYPN